jgi:hypothetical protein
MRGTPTLYKCRTAASVYLGSWAHFALEIGSDTMARTKARGGFRGHIVRISAFWRNDRPGGLGVGIDFHDDPMGGEEYSRHLSRTLDTWDKNAAPGDIVDQLRELANLETELSDRETFIAIADIYWLQERGHLETDEFNGVLWNWIADDTRTLVGSEQNPITLDPNTAIATGIDVTEIARAPGSEQALRTIMDHARTMGDGDANQPASLRDFLSGGVPRHGFGGSGVLGRKRRQS